MKSLTIVIGYEEGEIPEVPDFDGKLLGGSVIGIASHSLMKTMEIAESALNEINNEESLDALEAMKNVARGKIT